MSPVDQPLTQSEFILCPNGDGRTRVPRRFENETLWLKKVQIVGLFETAQQNLTLHLRAVFSEDERVEGAACKSLFKNSSFGKDLCHPERGRSPRRDLLVTGCIATADPSTRYAGVRDDKGIVPL